MPDDSAARGFKRVQVAQDATFFKLRAPLLDQGRMDTELVRTENMSARIKVYASGGENTLHTHATEDHIFVVLAGTVRFYDKNDKTRDLGRNDCVMLPAGTYYWFEATSTEPLVMMRIGAHFGDEGSDTDNRLNIAGKPMAGGSEENKSSPPVIRPNAFYE